MTSRDQMRKGSTDFLVLHLVILALVPGLLDQSANLHTIDLVQVVWMLQLWFTAALLSVTPVLRRA